MTLIEKILAIHSNKSQIKPGDIIDIKIDVRAARDFGGANVIKNIVDNNLTIDNPNNTFFTFDCNPTGSDQKYAVNQHICRKFARENYIKVFDIDKGIGTHLMIEQGLVWPGSTAVTTDSHANILGAICAFGQGMGDKDIAAVWNKGKTWFKVPKSVKINLNGTRPENISAKDIVLNLLDEFGANSLLGYAVEIEGKEVDNFTLDERITIASMATEMGCIIILIKPSELVLNYCSQRTQKRIEAIEPDTDAKYEQIFDLNLSLFKPKISKPGAPHNTENAINIKNIKIDSGFIGSCTNGRIEDMRAAAAILKDKKIALGVVLKIVPATNEVWQQCLNEGLIHIFKNAGAMLSNAGCAGCAAGQVGQNGSGEITISSGNRNFPGKQGKGEVYLASPAVVAASAIAGAIALPSEIHIEPILFKTKAKAKNAPTIKNKQKTIDKKPTILEGRVWLINEDNIDTDMIFHNRYLSITDIKEMGQYTFDNLKGYEDFAKKANLNDIVIVKKNFGSGSSRQQAVDCFKSLGIAAILAESFGAIYERNAINAAYPILTYKSIDAIKLSSGHLIRINITTGEIENLTNKLKTLINPFSEVQLEIYKNGGLF